MPAPRQGASGALGLLGTLADRAGTKRTGMVAMALFLMGIMKERWDTQLTTCMSSPAGAVTSRSMRARAFTVVWPLIYVTITTQLK